MRLALVTITALALVLTAQARAAVSWTNDLKEDPFAGIGYGSVLQWEYGVSKPLLGVTRNGKPDWLLLKFDVFGPLAGSNGSVPSISAPRAAVGPSLGYDIPITQFSTSVVVNVDCAVHDIAAGGVPSRQIETAMTLDLTLPVSVVFSAAARLLSPSPAPPAATSPSSSGGAGLLSPNDRMNLWTQQFIDGKMTSSEYAFLLDGEEELLANQAKTK
jgi:hypothetical protein